MSAAVLIEAVGRDAETALAFHTLCLEDFIKRE